MKQNKKTLSNKDMREIINALDNSSIVAVTDKHGNIIYVNKKFCEVSKYSQNELLNQNHRILKSGFHSPSFYKNLWSTISNGNVWGGDIKNKAKDGSFYWVRTIITPFLDKEGKPVKYIAIRTVVSEEKLSEEKAIKKTQDIKIKKLISDEKVKQLRKMEKIKDEFVAMLSHELKNPIIPIQGNSEILLDSKIGGKLTSTQKELIQDINKNASRLNEMVEELLDMQKINIKKMSFVYEEINARKFISTLFDNFSHILKRKKISNINSCDKKLLIQIDTNRTRQVLINLVKNAVDFLPKKNAIIEIGCFKKNKIFVFFVRDNGIGISKENQKLLFKKFHKIDTTCPREYGGSGLGLSICKGIVEGQGGKIWVESNVGKGSTFYFSIPHRTL